MPQPTQTDVHVDAILTNVSVAYRQDVGAYIAHQVAPILPMEKQSDKYFVYTKEDWFRDEAEERPDASESAGGGWNLSTDSYNATVWAFHKDVGRQARLNQDNPIDLDRDAARFVTQRLLIRQEKEWNSTFMTTGVWDTDKTGGTDFTEWDDYAASDPIQDIEDGKEQILSTTGFEANTLVLGYPVFRQLRHHPDVLERVKHTTRSDSVRPGADLLAELFEVDNVFVARAIENTAAEGATESYSFVHGKNALLCHVAPNPGVLTPSAMYTFAWRGISAGLGEDIAISRIDSPLLKAVRIEGEAAWDNKVVASDLGYFFSGAVT